MSLANLLVTGRKRSAWGVGSAGGRVASLDTEPQWNALGTIMLGFCGFDLGGNGVFDCALVAAEGHVVVCLFVCSRLLVNFEVY